MNGSLGLLDDHLVATTDENCDRLGARAVLNKEHAVVGRAKLHLPDGSGGTELVGRDLREAGNDAASSGDGDELNLAKLANKR